MNLSISYVSVFKFVVYRFQKIKKNYLTLSYTYKIVLFYMILADALPRSRKEEFQQNSFFGGINVDKKSWRNKWNVTAIYFVYKFL